MPNGRTADRAKRDAKIRLRASQKQRSLIDRAPAALDKNRSDFILEASCREAESVLLERRYFVLDLERFTEFVATLDEPPADNPRLRRLLSERAPWQR